MKAVKIDKKLELYKVIRSCRHIKNNKFYGEVSHEIFYNSKKREVFATDGVCFLIYKTDKIRELFGDVPNGILTLAGDYLIFDEYVGKLLSYEEFAKDNGAVKRSQIFFDYEADWGVFYECARENIKINPNVLKPLRELNLRFYGGYFSIFDKETFKFVSVVGCKKYENIKFVIISML